MSYSGQLLYHPSGYLYDQYYDVFVDPRTMRQVHPSIIHKAMMHMASPMPSVVPVAPVAPVVPVPVVPVPVVPVPVVPAPVINSINALSSQMHGISMNQNIRYFIKDVAGERELVGGVHEMIDILKEGRDCELIIRGIFDRQIKELIILPMSGLMELYMFDKKLNGSKGKQTFHLKHNKQDIKIILSYFSTNFHQILPVDVQIILTEEINRLYSKGRGGSRRITRFKKRPAKKHYKRKTIKVK